jgi:hypothetical protein
VPERVAIVGSREGADLEDVRGFVIDLWHKYPDTILVSGGAKGVDKCAETTWLAAGGQVESYRPVQIREGVYGIEKWELGIGQPRVYTLMNEPTWADFRSAATYRDILIAEVSDRVVSFMRDGGSRGAGFTAAMAENCYEKPTYRYFATVPCS